MMKKIISISKRYFVTEKFKLNDQYLQRSPKVIFNKIFLSHILLEENPQWVLKGNNGPQYIANHPSLKYCVSITNECDLSVKEDVYAIALMPLRNWLVQDRNKVVLFKDSYIASSMTKIVDEETDSILDVYLSANFLSEILSKVRPTGYIINAVTLHKPPILLGDLQTKDNQTYFQPLHKGFPPLTISTEEKLYFFNNKSGHRTDIFCEMIDWKYGSPAVGHLLSSCPLNFNQHSFLNPITPSPKLQLNLEDSITKLLESYNLKDKPFSKGILNSLTNEINGMLKINKKELKIRENFTEKCVISIDPIDAKDLDDALHIERLADGNFEVGVHIADVSHYVRPSSLVDNEAAVRASSIYLVHKVIPMLPELLSESLCSLLPDEDKLTFSVIFTIDSFGIVLNERFVKSLIRPTMRLNYDEASQIIEGNSENLSLKSHPEFERVKNSVMMLDELAKVLRRDRIRKGALVLDKIEVKFSSDENDSMCDNSQGALVSFPSSFHIKTSGSSNFLIEEWMLLANQAAARLLYNHALSNPDSQSKVGAVLRKHPPPDAKQKFEMRRISNTAGIKLSSIDSMTIQQQIQDLKITDPLKSLTLSYICYFNMQLAIYCCAEKSLVNESSKPDSSFHHYGLNVPLYTHFTSPIRRYADILVHRQINAIINSKPTCGTNLVARDEAVANSNSMRVANRRMKERLTTLYMSAYIKKEGWRFVKAVILKENKNKMSLLLPFSGIVLWCDMIDFAPWACEVTRSQPDSAKPMSLTFKYSEDDSKYVIETNNGFTQYVHQWHHQQMKGNNDEIEEEEEEEDEECLDMKIEEIRQKNSNRKYSEEKLLDEACERNDNYSTFSVRVFEMIDCVLFCSNDKLELLVQLPFPRILPQLKEDSSRHLL